MMTQSSPPARPDLKTQLAIALFGWQWRADWQAWCPPGWPAETSMGLWHGQRYQEQLLALQRHGGARSSFGGSLDDRGRSIIPDYEHNPEATEFLWQWLHAQPGMQSVRLVPLPIPPDSLRGVRPWRCEIVVDPDRVVTGEGDTHREALLLRGAGAGRPTRRGSGLGGGGVSKRTRDRGFIQFGPYMQPEKLVSYDEFNAGTGPQPVVCQRC